MTTSIIMAGRCTSASHRGGFSPSSGPFGHPALGARSVKTLRLLQTQQAFAHHEEVGERTGDHETMPVLRQAAIADLREAENALDHADRVLHADPDPRLPPIRRATPSAPMDEVARVRRADAQHAALPGICRIAPDAAFPPMEQPRQDVTVMDVGRRHFDRVNELALAVDPEVALHPEVPLPPLLRLVHRGVA